VVFTAVLWEPHRSSSDDDSDIDPFESDLVTIDHRCAFPYLDMEMFWLQGELNFRVHLKPNQELRYLNTLSVAFGGGFRGVLSDR